MEGNRPLKMNLIGGHNGQKTTATEGPRKKNTDTKITYINSNTYYQQKIALVYHFAQPRRGCAFFHAAV